MWCSLRNGSARRGRCRRWISAVLLFVYVVTAAGVPLPSGARSQKADGLFPCSASGCGCDSAERCWRSCCCHTLAERLSWAQKHGVRPPAFAIAQARRAGFDLAWLSKPGGVDCGSLAKQCCVASGTRTAQSCCENKLASAPAAPARACCKSKTGHNQPPSEKVAGHVVAWQALKCHGHSLNWLAAVPTLVVVRPELSHQLPLVAWLGPHSSHVAAGVADVPTPPPPERA